jgi:hypothetical protein
MADDKGLVISFILQEPKLLLGGYKMASGGGCKMDSGCKMVTEAVISFPHFLFTV